MVYDDERNLQEVPTDLKRLDYLATKSPFYPIEHKSKPLSNLTNKQRQVVVLRASGNSYAEIGKIIKKSKSVCYRIYKRAEKKIKATI